MLLELLGDEMLVCDVDLLFLCITRYADNFHPVQKRARDRGCTVSCRDEEHLRQVKWNIQVAGSQSRMTNVQPIQMW